MSFHLITHYQVVSASILLSYFVSCFVGDKSAPLAVASRFKIAICYWAVFTSALLLYLIFYSLIKTYFCSMDLMMVCFNFSTPPLLFMSELRMNNTTLSFLSFKGLRPTFDFFSLIPYS